MRIHHKHHGIWNCFNEADIGCFMFSLLCSLNKKDKNALVYFSTKKSKKFQSPGIIKPEQNGKRIQILKKERLTN